MELVRDKLGSTWNGDLRVWIPEEKGWEMESNIALVGSMTIIQKMDLHSVISPVAYSRFHTPSATPATPTPHAIVVNISSDDEEDGEGIHDGIGSHHPSSDLPEVEDIIPTNPNPSNSNLSTADDEPPAPTDNTEPNVVTLFPYLEQGWPTQPRPVSMKSLCAFVALTVKPKNLLIKSAFNRVYGQTHVYAPSTVSKYRRWVIRIDAEALNAYINNGNPTLSHTFSYYLW
ncbi:uncharacterized protein MELLADRAFT_92017 [Melampsora larici-populina 98AG31]|uniref:Uncharacterized protein n=1 Tax=Melampsora larici-populina (strain 98AG31 / pathotype 3-4-7) TaxID=747676 RepID=F4S183_MELLP|nr:uncharacterized protein MELLADRAFT_92017 [Melampsora larici-populina 98AG31]EGG01607.1 hypothetical protein MELLADRAFT_92017 [Melampsora larici-populina 98AG31]